MNCAQFWLRLLPVIVLMNPLFVCFQLYSKDLIKVPEEHYNDTETYSITEEIENDVVNPLHEVTSEEDVVSQLTEPNNDFTRRWKASGLEVTPGPVGRPTFSLVSSRTVIPDQSELDEVDDQALKRGHLPINVDKNNEVLTEVVEDDPAASSLPLTTADTTANYSSSLTNAENLQRENSTTLTSPVTSSLSSREHDQALNNSTNSLNDTKSDDILLKSETSNMSHPKGSTFDLKGRTPFTTSVKHASTHNLTEGSTTGNLNNSRVDEQLATKNELKPSNNSQRQSTFKQINSIPSTFKLNNAISSPFKPTNDILAATKPADDFQGAVKPANFLPPTNSNTMNINSSSRMGSFGNFDASNIRLSDSSGTNMHHFSRSTAIPGLSYMDSTDFGQSSRRGTGFAQSSVSTTNVTQSETSTTNPGQSAVSSTNLYPSSSSSTTGLSRSSSSSMGQSKPNYASLSQSALTSSSADQSSTARTGKPDLSSRRLDQWSARGSELNQLASRTDEVDQSDLDSHSLGLSGLTTASTNTTVIGSKISDPDWTSSGSGVRVYDAYGRKTAISELDKKLVEIQKNMEKNKLSSPVNPLAPSFPRINQDKVIEIAGRLNPSSSFADVKYLRRDPYLHQVDDKDATSDARITPSSRRSFLVDYLRLRDDLEREKQIRSRGFNYLQGRPGIRSPYKRFNKYRRMNIIHAPRSSSSPSNQSTPGQSKASQRLQSFLKTVKQMFKEPQTAEDIMGWEPWSPCSRTCGKRAFRTRQRECGKLVQSDFDVACPEPRVQTEKCEEISCSRKSRKEKLAEFLKLSDEDDNRLNQRANSEDDQKTVDQVFNKQLDHPQAFLADNGIKNLLGLLGEEKSDDETSGDDKEDNSNEDSDNGVVSPSNVGNAQPMYLYTVWGSWSTCTHTCGQRSYAFRKRYCINAVSGEIKRHCQRPTILAKKCSVDPCPVDGGLSQWSEWSSCSDSCGIMERHRSCTNPKPAYGGKGCHKLPVQMRMCGRCKDENVAAVNKLASYSPKFLCGFDPCKRVGCLENRGAICVTDFECNPTFFNDHGDVLRGCTDNANLFLRPLGQKSCPFNPCTFTKCDVSEAKCLVDTKCRPFFVNTDGKKVECKGSNILQISSELICGFNPCQITTCTVDPDAKCVTDYRCNPLFINSAGERIPGCTEDEAEEAETVTMQRPSDDEKVATTSAARVRTVWEKHHYTDLGDSSEKYHEEQPSKKNIRGKIDKNIFKLATIKLLEKILKRRLHGEKPVDPEHTLKKNNGSTSSSKGKESFKTSENLKMSHENSKSSSENRLESSANAKTSNDTPELVSHKALNSNSEKDDAREGHWKHSEKDVVVTTVHRNDTETTEIADQTSSRIDHVPSLGNKIRKNSLLKNASSRVWENQELNFSEKPIHSWADAVDYIESDGNPSLGSTPLRHDMRDRLRHKQEGNLEQVDDFIMEEYKKKKKVENSGMTSSEISDAQGYHGNNSTTVDNASEVMASSNTSGNSSVSNSSGDDSSINNNDSSSIMNNSNNNNNNNNNNNSSSMKNNDVIIDNNSNDHINKSTNINNNSSSNSAPPIVTVNLPNNTSFVNNTMHFAVDVPNVNSMNNDSKSEHLGMQGNATGYQDSESSADKSSGDGDSQSGDAFVYPWENYLADMANENGTPVSFDETAENNSSGQSPYSLDYNDVDDDFRDFDFDELVNKDDQSSKEKSLTSDGDKGPDEPGGANSARKKTGKEKVNSLKPFGDLNMQIPLYDMNQASGALAKIESQESQDTPSKANLKGILTSADASQALQTNNAEVMAGASGNTSVKPSSLHAEDKDSAKPLPVQLSSKIDKENMENKHPISNAQLVLQVDIQDKPKAVPPSSGLPHLPKAVYDKPKESSSASLQSPPLSPATLAHVSPPEKPLQHIPSAQLSNSTAKDENATKLNDMLLRVVENEVAKLKAQGLLKAPDENDSQDNQGQQEISEQEKGMSRQDKGLGSLPVFDESTNEREDGDNQEKLGYNQHEHADQKQEDDIQQLAGGDLDKASLKEIDDFLKQDNIGLDNKDGLQETPLHENRVSDVMDKDEGTIESTNDYKVSLAPTRDQGMSEDNLGEDRVSEDNGGKDVHHINGAEPELKDSFSPALNNEIKELGLDEYYIKDGFQRRTPKHRKVEDGELRHVLKSGDISQIPEAKYSEGPANSDNTNNPLRYGKELRMKLRPVVPANSRTSLRQHNSDGDKIERVPSIHREEASTQRSRTIEKEPDTSVLSSELFNDGDFGEENGDSRTRSLEKYLNRLEHYIGNMDGSLVASGLKAKHREQVDQDKELARALIYSAKDSGDASRNSGQDSENLRSLGDVSRKDHVMGKERTSEDIDGLNQNGVITLRATEDHPTRSKKSKIEKIARNSRRFIVRRKA